MLPLSKNDTLVPVAREVLGLLQPRRHVRLRRHPVDRPPLPPPGRGRHAVLRHRRLRVARGPGRDRARPGHDRAGPGAHRRPRRRDRAAASPPDPAPGRRRPPVPAAGRLVGRRSILSLEPRCRSSTTSTTSTAGRPMELKDLLGGKGANLAEMTSVLGPAGAPRLHHHHRRLPGLHGRRLARRASTTRWPRPGGRLEKKMGKRLGDAADPLLVSVRSGAKFSMPGMMDTVLNLGLNDESVEGLAKQTDDERFAFDSYRRFVAMYGRIVLGIDGEAFDTPARGGQGAGRRHHRRRRSPSSCSAYLVDAYKQIVERAHRRPVPPGSRRPAARRHRGRVPVVERRRAPSPTGTTRASPTTSAPPSTSRPWCSATATTTRAPASASPATRPPGRRASTATSWSTPRARTWSPASATPSPCRR